MKKHRLIAILMAVLFALSACEGEVVSPQLPAEESSPIVSPRPAQIKNAEFALPYNGTASLDPLNTSDSLNLALAGLVYEGLFQLDNNFSAQPLLCAGYSSDLSCTVWSFTIREDACFSDGTPLTASHVADALKAARSSELYRARLSGIATITSSQAAVTITLSTPNGSLPALLDIPVTLPSEEGLPPLGTGLYFFAVAEDGNFMLRENPYRRQEYALQRENIPLYSTPAADQRVAAFDSGLITLVPTDFSSPSALGYSCNYEIQNSPTTSMLYVIYHCQSDFCSDPILRQAISRCLDRDTVAKEILFGEADSAALPISPHSNLYNSFLARSLAYDPDAAEQLLAESGYYHNEAGSLFTPEKKQVELYLLVNADNSYRVSVAQYLAENLSQLGISVHITALPWGSYMAALESGSFDLCLAQTKLTADFNLSPLLTADALNYGLYVDMKDGKPMKEEDSPTLALLAAANGATGHIRLLSYQRLLSHLSSVSPFTPLCFTRTSSLTRWGTLSNVSLTQQNLFYQFHLWEFR